MMGWTVFEVAVNLFQAVLIVYFLKKQLNTSRRSVVADLACVLGITGWLTLYVFYDVPIVDTFVFILPMIYSCWVFDDKWHVVLFWNVLIALIFSGAVNLTSSFYMGFLKANWEQLMGETPLRIAFVVSSNLLMLILVIILTKIKNRAGQVPWYSFALLLALNLLCLISIEFLFAMGLDSDIGLLFSGICLCLFAISILSIILYEVLADSAFRQQQYKLENERLKLVQKYNQEMQSVYEDMAAFRHDMKHQMQTISQMVSGHDRTSVQNYFEALNNRVSALQPFATGNIAVDALLTAKASIMRHNEITFNFNPYPVNDLPIGESDFCALLGNLLDNAIEGVGRLPDTNGVSVSLSFARTWDMFFITCENPYDPKTVRRIRDRFASSKAEIGHGIGTHSIEAIARHANGYARFTLNEDIFRVEIVLPYKREMENDHD